MKRLFQLLLFASVLLSLPALSQSQAGKPLIVKGKVLSLEIESNETWQFKYQVRIELHYINVSHHSLIMFRWEPLLLNDASLEENEETNPTFSTEEGYFDNPFDLFDESAPPDESTVVIPSGGEYVVQSQIGIPIKRSNEFVKRLKGSSFQAVLNIGLVPWPRLFATHRSPAVEDLDSDELSALLNKRWRQYGRLAENKLDVEPIELELTLPSETPKSTGLILRGTLTNWDSQKDVDGYLDLTASLNLEFVNTGPRPVLILKPDSTGYGQYWLGANSLIATTSENITGENLWDWAAWPSNYRNKVWEDRQASIQKSTAPEEYFWIIQPGQSHAFSVEDTLRFDMNHCQGCFPDQLSWSELQKKRKEYDQLWLVIQIEIWPFNLETIPHPDNPVLGREMRARWSKIGILELGKDGILTSERIPVKLPDLN